MLKAGIVDMEIMIMTKHMFAHLNDDPALENVKEEFITNINACETAADRV
jgi:hypothetical protein